jgi:hypothetical protein
MNTDHPPAKRSIAMRHLGMLIVIAVGAVAWPSAASAQHVTLPDPAVEACEAAVDNQVEQGIQPGGGPKGVDVAPINCDAFWFRYDFIGNERAGGPHTCFWAIRREHPEQCPPGS